MEFVLPFHITNNGDGSASVKLHPTLAEAEKAEEEMSKGWGESCAGTLRIKVEGKKLYYHNTHWAGNKYVSKWIEVTEK